MKKYIVFLGRGQYLKCNAKDLEKPLGSCSIRCSTVAKSNATLFDDRSLPERICNYELPMEIYAKYFKTTEIKEVEV